MSDQEKHNSRFEELCSAYVLGALTSDEKAEFDVMLENASDEERVLYSDLTATSAHIALLAKNSEPGANLKDRILRFVLGKGANVLTMEPSSGWSRSARYAVAASFILFAVSLSLGIYSVNLSTEIDGQEVVIRDQETRITNLTEDLARKEELLAILESRDIDLVLMAGADVNPDGYGKVIWDSENQQAILQIANLPSLPTDKDYQLWLIQEDGTPINSGVLPLASSSTDAFLKIEELAPKDPTANTFAITLEPKGGVPQPTGSIYLVGQTN